MIIPESEYQITTMRSSGPGGQHANKVETAVQLRFDIRASSFETDVKDKLLALNDHRITKDRVIILKSSRFRSQLKNREAVVNQLQSLIQQATKKRKKRKPTRPSKLSVIERLDEKNKRGKIKDLRKSVKPPQDM